jgi:hypothetical protein
MPKPISLVILAVFFTQLAWAQQFYRWNDEKGQWHYSDFVPKGVTVEKLAPGDADHKPASEPPVPSAAEQKKTADGSDRTTQRESEVDPLGSVSRRLLVFPPSDRSKSLPQWIPVDSFGNVEECNRARRLLIERTPDDFVDFRLLNSRCISLAEFQPSKQANVIMAVTELGPDPGGFSTSVLYGKVFNGGQTTARNVVVRYRSRDARGIIYAEGDIPTAPQHILPLTFAEYRGQIQGSVSGSDRWVETEAQWSKD